jgi:tetratricopeptide (TPR) repeat protein
MLGPTARERAQEALEQGLLALRKKERATAGKFFRAAVVADPTFDRGRQALISLLLEADLKDSAEALAVDGIAQGAAKATFALIAARLKLEHGAAKDAIALLEQEQAGGKSNADYLALWANALTREHRFREAAAKYADAVALAPTNPAHQVGLAYALRNDGQYVAAHEVFSRVHAMEGINPQLANLVDLQLQSLRRFLTAAPASAPRSNP